MSPSSTTADDVRATIRDLAGEGIDVVVGIEARGFILGAPLAVALGVANLGALVDGTAMLATIPELFGLQGSHREDPRKEADASERAYLWRLSQR